MAPEVSDPALSSLLDEANEAAVNCVATVAFLRSESCKPASYMLSSLYDSHDRLAKVLPLVSGEFGLAASRVSKTRLGDVRRLASWHETALNEAARTIQELSCPGGQLFVTPEANGAVRFSLADLQKNWPLIRAALVALPHFDLQEFRETLRDERLQANAGKSASVATTIPSDVILPAQTSAHPPQANEPPNELLDELTGQQVKLLNFLWKEPHGVSWNSLPRDAFQDEDDRSDAAVKRALERLQKRLNEFYERFQIGIEINADTRRVKLEKPTRTNADK